MGRKRKSWLVPAECLLPGGAPMSAAGAQQTCIDSLKAEGNDAVMKRMKRLELVVDDTVNAAYLYLKQHPERGPDSDGCVADTVILEDLLPNYRGPDISLDFDREGVLIGLEIIG